MIRISKNHRALNNPSCSDNNQFNENYRGHSHLTLIKVWVLTMCILKCILKLFLIFHITNHYSLFHPSKKVYSQTVHFRFILSLSSSLDFILYSYTSPIHQPESLSPSSERFLWYTHPFCHQPLSPSAAREAFDIQKKFVALKRRNFSGLWHPKEKDRLLGVTNSDVKEVKS